MINVFPKYGFVLAALLCLTNGLYNLFTGYYGWSMISIVLTILCVTGFKWFNEAMLESKDN